jgi:hypothetical protein
MYYPKSQIKSNLYTNGGKYILSTTKEDYKGYYYEISTGQKYTGKFPQDGLNILLTQPSLFLPDQFPQSPSNELIITQNEANNDSYKILSPVRTLPQFNPTLPTSQDQQNGQFNRYFCKKTNENKYLEIDQDTYKKLINKDPQIAWDLYNPAQITWIIKGNQNQVFNSNKGSVVVIEQQRSWYGFTQWFQDKFLKYYLES